MLPAARRAVNKKTHDCSLCAEIAPRYGVAPLGSAGRRPADARGGDHSVPAKSTEENIAGARAPDGGAADVRARGRATLLI